MTIKFPVLDDTTSDARIIGYAETAEEAQAIYVADIIENSFGAENEEIVVPTFTRYSPEELTFGKDAWAPV